MGKWETRKNNKLYKKSLVDGVGVLGRAMIAMATEMPVHPQAREGEKLKEM